MKKHTTRRALVMSLLSLLLCCSMLVGTTFAWFTDSVQSGNNTIIAGNLDVELTHTSASVKTAETVESKTNLFVDENGDQILWEPGVVAWENLTVYNKGTLALKYRLSVNFTDLNAVKITDAKLSKALKVAVVAPIAADATREQVLTAAGTGIALESFVEEGKLLPKDSTLTVDDADDVAKTYGLVIWWEPSSEDNKWNIQNGAETTDGEALQIDLGINLVATQLEAEGDSFGTDYDKEATYPAVASETIDGTDATTIKVGEVYVTIPAGVEPGNYTVRVDSKDETVNEQGALVADYEIDLLKDGVKVETQNGVQYGVSIDVGKNRIVEAVAHNGEDVASFDYDENTGLVSFVTDSFSPFSVTYYVKYAKVGEITYTSVEEALANWKNNTTLTLLEDITLPDVVTLKSTEHHILNLGTHTLTAADGKNAFEIQACGNGGAERTAITIRADATNPGGINAGKKSVVYYDYANGGISGDDRPIIKIEGGVFTGTTAAWGTAGIYFRGGSKARQAATLNVSGGTFNCSINGQGKSKLLISGGTFNYSVGSQGDSTALRLISGGKFKSFGFMTADSNNTKFWIGTSMANSNVGVYVDRNNYLVVGGPVITEPGDKFETQPKSYSSWSSYLKYSSAATYGLYYEKAE